MILLDTHNPRAKSLHDDFSREQRKFLEELDFNIVIGGDGWMLDCIRTHGPERVFLGINAGTLGFLLHDIENNKKFIEMLKGHEWKTFHFPLLKIDGISHTDTHFSALALNDVYVDRESGRAANLRVTIDGEEVVERLVCDGLVVATSLGSTAYSSSAGGSPSHPLIRALHITPICPHTPRLRSFIVPETSVITIEGLNHERRPIQAVSDGVDHGRAKSLTIQTADKEVRIAYLNDHTFTETMIRKILRS